MRVNNMHIATISGKATFAEYVVSIKGKYKFDSSFPFHVEDSQIVCYTGDEKNNVIAYLDKQKIDYTIEKLFTDAEIINKTKDILYQTPDEVRDHILHNIEPESQLIPNLLKRLKDSEEKDQLIHELTTRLESVEREISSIKKLSVL